MAVEPKELSQGPPRPASNVTRMEGVIRPAPDPSHTLFLIDLSPEAAREFKQLMAHTGDNPTELFQKALGLYKITKEAIQQGKVVGIAETEDCLETRFVGL